MVKKLMDLPNYFERLNFIRNSVCGEIDIILNPPKIEEITNPKSENPSWSYTQMCRERLRSWDITIFPWEGYSAYCARVGR